MLILALVAGAAAFRPGKAQASSGAAMVLREGLADFGPVDVWCLDQPRMRLHYLVHPTSRRVEPEVRARLEGLRDRLRAAVHPRGAVFEVLTDEARLPQFRINDDPAWGGVNANEWVRSLEGEIERRSGPATAFLSVVPVEGAMPRVVSDPGKPVRVEVHGVVRLVHGLTVAEAEKIARDALEARGVVVTVLDLEGVLRWSDSPP
jgi:hypothetical protein